MKKILFLVAEGFEEVELVAPFDLLQRGGVKVALAAVGDDVEVKGSHGLRIRTDFFLQGAHLGDFDGVFVPGGGLGVKNLCASVAAAECVKAFAAAGKWIAAICAGPKVLALAGLTHDKAITSYPSVEAELKPLCRRYVQDRVCLDGKLLTSRGAGTAEEFALAFLAALEGEDAARAIRQKIVAR